MCLYGEGLPLKHLPKILGKPKPRPHVRVEWYLLPWSENKHLCISWASNDTKHKKTTKKLHSHSPPLSVRILCVFAAYFHLCAINFPLWPAFMLCVCESCLNVLCTGKQTQTVSRKYRENQ